jgi:KDO2-lipid IV(A) lauroyltransferase
LVRTKTISSRPRREAARQILKALRKNEVVLLVADEFKSGGVEVEFLGCRVSAQRGPVTLAMRAGSPLLPMFVTRNEKDQLTLHIGSELNLIQTGNIQENVDANVVLFTSQLEAMVRRYPEQWSWLGFRENGTPRNQIGVSQSSYRGQQTRISS